MAFKDNAVELEERVVAVNRVTKVVKGGRRLRFAALVVVTNNYKSCKAKTTSTFNNFCNTVDGN